MTDHRPLSPPSEVVNAERALVPTASVSLAANPTDGELTVLARIATMCARAGLHGKLRTPEQAGVLILMGREMGLPAMTALSTIHIVDGKPTAGVHALGALLARGGVRWSTTHTDGACTVRFDRPGWPPHAATWTDDDTKAAGLAAKDNWRKYPRAMRYARAYTEGARVIGPDLLAGVLYTPEEWAPDRPVREDGTPIDAPQGLPAPVRDVTAATEEDVPDTGDGAPPVAPSPAAPPMPPLAERATESQRKKLLAAGRERGLSLLALTDRLAQAAGCSDRPALYHLAAARRGAWTHATPVPGTPAKVAWWLTGGLTRAEAGRAIDAIEGVSEPGPDEPSAAGNPYEPGARDDDGPGVTAVVETAPLPTVARPAPDPTDDLPF